MDNGERNKTIERILYLIAEEGFSLRRACIETDTKKSTFRDWMAKDTELTVQYIRAIEDRAELKCDSIQDDYNATPQRDPDTGKIDAAWVNLQRLKIDSKKWELSKLLPKVYGNQIDITSLGEKIERIYPPWMDDGKPKP